MSLFSTTVAMFVSEPTVSKLVVLSSTSVEGLKFLFRWNILPTKLVHLSLVECHLKAFFAHATNSKY